MINITKYNIIITIKVECEPKACTSLNKMINYKLFQLFKVIKPCNLCSEGRDFKGPQTLNYSQICSMTWGLWKYRYQDNNYIYAINL